MAVASETTRGLPDYRSRSRGLSGIDWIAMVLLIVGGLNWGLVGSANFDLVAALFGAGTMLTRIVYGLVGLSALWAIAMCFRLASSRDF